MTTFEAVAVGLLRRTSANLEARAAKRANRRATAKTAVTALAPRVRRFTLMVGALTAFTYAAWSWSMIAGLVVAGVSALYLEQSYSDD